ncbi:glutathione S-transferase 1-like [Ceratina calcarata]|uniref:Glutathione S-transferase 1-like n=1 Tax=Ceratina calcarata TaxID=156304 RepID=A0AAJ7JGE6_9HYME|nr:glutathione S-transferase 1-like [Ceratina calcarata]
MPKVVLYAQDISPPCRTVLIVAHQLGLDLEIREVNLKNKEQLSEEFRKVNPQHTIPVMDDNGFILLDSHAIVTYLVDKYGKNDSLYPKDLQKRALVDQYLHFDSWSLFPAARNAFRPLFLQSGKEISEDKMKVWRESYEHLNSFLEGKNWLVDDSYTLADISCVTTASSSAILVNMDDFPNVKAWIERCEAELPGYKQHNLPGRDKLFATVRALMA